MDLKRQPLSCRLPKVVSEYSVLRWIGFEIRNWLVDTFQSVEFHCPATGRNTMSNHGTELPLGDSERALIVEFWNQVALCDEPRGASRELLEELERTVTDCLYLSLIHISEPTRPY